MTDLQILASGAVTAVGMTAAQSCAAVRAKLKRVTPIEPEILDWEEPRVGARVSADPRLRSDEATWLLNLAGRALLECVDQVRADTPLIWLVPEDHRGHPLCAGVPDRELLSRLEQHIGRSFAPGSRILRNGAAGCVDALGLARDMFEAGETQRCLIGGADSLLRPADIAALSRANRLLGPRQSQGLVPGEGAAFMVVSPRERREQTDVIDLSAMGIDAEAAANDDGAELPAEPVLIRGLGIDYERNTVLGTEYSVGQALAKATATALMDADLGEPSVGFLAGNFNGERYDAWENAHGRGRAFPTRRERLPTLWSAGSTGELGVAGGVMALLATADAIAEGYAEGPVGAVWVRSEDELRGVAILATPGEHDELSPKA